MMACTMMSSLLGICFFGEAPEPAVGPDRRAGKRGLRGKRGVFGVLWWVGGRCFGKKSSGVGRDMAALGDFGGKIIARERIFPGRLAKISFGSGFLGY